MKVWKTLVFALSLVLLTVGFAGCSSDDKKSDADKVKDALKNLKITTVTDGQTVTPTAAAIKLPVKQDDATIVWTSDSDAAKVAADGTLTVTPKATETTVVLTGTLTVGKETQLKKITIKVPAAVVVVTLKITSTDTTVKAGDTIALTANKTVTWTVDKADLAKVDSATGKLTGIKEGKVVVTATAGTETATVDITVTAAVVIPTNTAITIHGSFIDWGKTITDVVTTDKGNGVWEKEVAVAADADFVADWVEAQAPADTKANVAFKFMTGDLWGHLPGAAGPDYGIAGAGFVAADGDAVKVIANNVDGGAGNIFAKFVAGKTYIITLDTKSLTVKIATKGGAVVTPTNTAITIHGSFIDWGKTITDVVTTDKGNGVWEKEVAVAADADFIADWVEAQAPADTKANVAFKFMTGDLWGHLPGTAGPDYGIAGAGFVAADGDAVTVIANNVDGGAGNIFAKFVAGKTYIITLDTKKLTVKVTTKTDTPVVTPTNTAITIHGSFIDWGKTITDVVTVDKGNGVWAKEIAVAKDADFIADWVEAQAPADTKANVAFKFMTGDLWGHLPGATGPDYGIAGAGFVAVDGDAVAVIANKVDGGAGNIFAKFVAGKTYIITLDTKKLTVAITTKTDTPVVTPTTSAITIHGSFIDWGKTITDVVTTDKGNGVWEKEVAVAAGADFIADWVEAQAPADTKANVAFKFMTGDLWGHLPGATGPDYGIAGAGFVAADGDAVTVIANKVDGGAGNIFAKFVAGKTYIITLDTKKLTVAITTKK